ncbi:hypothetical protein Prudu_006456 [Prunus dulcis]|uniref:Disease resistance protein TIR-NBS-LRR class family n=1 Tax=Prunus dulcis TaxID=3755 RepID=A0A4Y1QZZ3_PRUDU|nr:hypothetical protein Prudu_006456 [Prunus dulcis]
MPKHPISLTMQMGEMGSVIVFKADEIPIGQLPTLPYTLVVLSLVNCNLSDDSFPREFGNIPSLQKLDLSHNPICSVPDFIRGLTGLDQLAFGHCTRLKLLVRIPRVNMLVAIHCDSLEKVTFQSISCIPGRFINCYNSKLVEIEYWYKLEPIGRVDAEMRSVLGLCNLESMEAIGIRMYTPDLLSSGAGEIGPIQGLHESGIYSTFLPGHEVPGQFSDRSEGSSVSFTVPPLLPNLRIRGLNIFTVYTGYFNGYSYSLPNPPLLRVCNKTKGLKWIYAPSCHGVPYDENQVMWLSHWKLGSGLESGDEVSVSVFMKPSFRVKECGIQLVYEQEDEMSTQHNTIVPSYLSAIGRDRQNLFQEHTT